VTPPHVHARTAATAVSTCVVAAVILAVAAPQGPSGQRAPDRLPPAVHAKLLLDLASAKPFRQHVWRDTPPFNPDGTLNGYVEIERGDPTKWEFRIAKNAREVDRVLPADVGGFPTGYGFVPGTISHDGDPLDVLVLGPPTPAGAVVKGVLRGLLEMTDEKGWDGKVVISPVDDRQMPLFSLDEETTQAVAAFFAQYKKHEAAQGKFSTVSGWAGAPEALRVVRLTERFFQEGRRTSREGAGGKTGARP
jgi:inorganic pyrophosphatase